jgi:hypothetical protein
MKKTLIFIFMLLFTLTLVSCNDDKTEDKTEKEKTKELIPVDSVTVKDKNEEDFIITKDTPFYEVFELVNIDWNSNSKLCEGYVVFFDANIKHGDSENVHITGELYQPDLNTYYWNLETADKNQKKYTFEMYFSNIMEKNDSGETIKFLYQQYNLHRYGEELAMFGFDDGILDGKEISAYYYGKYPSSPEGNTDFSNLFNSTYELVKIFNTHRLFDEYHDVEYRGEVFSLEEHVSRSFKLYEDYIVFELSTPFGDNLGGVGQEIYSYYNSSISGNYKLTQTVKYNIRTKKIETVSIRGNVLQSSGYNNTPMTLDINVEFEQISKKKFNNEVDKLIDFVRKNAKD